MTSTISNIATYVEKMNEDLKLIKDNVSKWNSSKTQDDYEKLKNRIKTHSDQLVFLIKNQLNLKTKSESDNGVLKGIIEEFTKSLSSITESVKPPPS